MTRQEKLVFCTLFDSNYLDKGLALYLSMKKNIGAFRLYIFAFDRKCFDVLADMELTNVVLLSVNDILNDDLRKVEKERTTAEFCWTCTPYVIGYVLQKYKEKICTYIDADTYFFSNPISAIQEIIDNKCSVGLVEHRFERNYEYGIHIFSKGKYCIQFNTFINSEEGMEVLQDWQESCLKWCYYRYEDGKLGDQKYPDKWRQKYYCVHESKNFGVGVAPWNLHQYTLYKNKDGKISLRYKDKEFPLVLYHFEGMKYLKSSRVYLNIWKPESRKMHKKIYAIYGEYFRMIIFIRRYLAQNYDITFRNMLLDDEVYLNGCFSLKKLCNEHGLLRGSKQWFSHRKNNVMFTDRLLHR